MCGNNYKDFIKFLIMIKMKIMMIPLVFDDVFIPARERGQRGRTYFSSKSSKETTLL